MKSYNYPLTVLLKVSTEIPKYVFLIAGICSAVEEIQNILSILEENENIQVADNIPDDAENVEVCIG